MPTDLEGLKTAFEQATTKSYLPTPCNQEQYPQLKDNTPSWVVVLMAAWLASSRGRRVPDVSSSWITAAQERIGKLGSTMFSSDDDADGDAPGNADGPNDGGNAEQPASPPAQPYGEDAEQPSQEDEENEEQINEDTDQPASQDSEGLQMMAEAYPPCPNPADAFIRTSNRAPLHEEPPNWKMFHTSLCRQDRQLRALKTAQRAMNATSRSMTMDPTQQYMNNMKRTLQKEKVSAHAWLVC